jgi:hypothetical protein
VPSDNRPVRLVYIKTHPGGLRSPAAGYLTLSGANAAASASAQRDNVKVTDITGDDSNLIRDVSWRHVPYVTMYNNRVLGMSETRRSSELRLASTLTFLKEHVALEHQVWLNLTC